MEEAKKSQKRVVRDPRLSLRSSTSPSGQALDTLDYQPSNQQRVPGFLSGIPLNAKSLSTITKIHSRRNVRRKRCHSTVLIIISIPSYTTNRL